MLGEVKGPTGKRETAITMSRMLKSLLDELDVEYGYRKLEWNKVEHVLVGRARRQGRSGSGPPAGSPGLKVKS